MACTLRSASRVHHSRCPGYASKPSMVDARRLRLLVELAERGTIAAVAEALHFSASSVSYALARLEEEVGVGLLERGPREGRLTAAGSALAAEGRRALEQLEAAGALARAVSADDGSVTL